MSWHLLTRPEVPSDINQGAQWYDEREPGTRLRAEFAREVWQTIDRLRTDALLYRVRDAKLQVRWVIPPRFPYRIIYAIKGDTVVILAVIHTAKRDREWKRRVR